MRFIKLSDAELRALNDGHRNGRQFLFRNRCQSLILSHQGYTIAQLMKLFKVHRVTVYAWFDLWESGGIEALHKKPGQGRRPKLSPANPKHVECVRAAVEGERQNLKAVVAQLSAELEIQMHPDTLKRFLKTRLHFPPFPQMPQDASESRTLPRRRNESAPIAAIFRERLS